MPYLNPEKSFIAAVQCHTPDYCGFWDCAELAEQAGAVKPVLGDWLTVHNCPQTQNHLFRFDCYYDDRGYCGYNIESFTKGQGRAWSTTGIRFGFSSSGYVALYPVTAAPATFWWPRILEEGVERDIIEDLGEGVITNVLVRSPDKWAIKPYKREEVGDYWHVYTNDAQGPNMQLSLHIHRLQRDYIDDH